MAASTLRIAVVGSGPAGFYAAGALLAEALNDREKEQLNGLLRRVLITLEDRSPGKRD